MLNRAVLVRGVREPQKRCSDYSRSSARRASGGIVSRFAGSAAATEVDDEEHEHEAQPGRPPEQLAWRGCVSECRRELRVGDRVQTQERDRAKPKQLPLLSREAPWLGGRQVLVGR